MTYIARKWAGLRVGGALTLLAVNASVTEPHSQQPGTRSIWFITDAGSPSFLGVLNSPEDARRGPGTSRSSERPRAFAQSQGQTDLPCRSRGSSGRRKHVQRRRPGGWAARAPRGAGVQGGLGRGGSRGRCGLQVHPVDPEWLFSFSLWFPQAGWGRERCHPSIYSDVHASVPQERR